MNHYKFLFPHVNFGIDSPCLSVSYCHIFYLPPSPFYSNKLRAEFSPAWDHAACRVGWSDFLRKNLGTCHVVLVCCGTPNPKFHFDLLLFHLMQGLTGPQKILSLTLKSAKLNFSFNIFNGCTGIEICSLVYLKYKKEEKLKKIVFPLTRSKTVLPILGA